MSKKKSDALQALIAEVVELDRSILVALEEEEQARLTFVAARQELDSRQGTRTSAEENRKQTQRALDIIASRDSIGEDVIATLKVRASERDGR